MAQAPTLDPLERIIDQAGTEALQRIYALIEDPAEGEDGGEVCPGCESGEHELMLYLDLCKCKCACHGGRK